MKTKKKQYALAHSMGIMERNQMLLYNLTDNTIQRLKLDEKGTKWSRPKETVGSTGISLEKLQVWAKGEWQFMCKGYGFQILDIWTE